MSEGLTATGMGDSQPYFAPSSNARFISRSAGVITSSVGRDDGVGRHGFESSLRSSLQWGDKSNSLHSSQLENTRSVVRLLDVRDATNDSLVPLREAEQLIL